MSGTRFDSINDLLYLAEQYNRGGRFADAEPLYRQILSAQPDHVDALSGLGVLCAQSGDIPAAIELLSRATSLEPNNAAMLNNLGNTLAAAGQFDRAVACFQRALGQNFQPAITHSNLGNALFKWGKIEESIDSFKAAVALDPSSAQAQYNLATALQAQMRHLDEAVAGFQRVLQLNPRHALAHNNLGNCLRALSRLDEAIACYQRALSLGYTPAHSNWLYALVFRPGIEARDLLREGQVWDQLHALPLRSEISSRHDNIPDPNRRLRIGYVSPDFRSHAESHFVLPLLEAHDHGQFEIHCYSSVARPDAITDRHRKAADVWHDCFTLSDAQLADRIRSDGIDILVDLTMHMAHNRLLAFARKPASIQISWLAYPGTTGLGAINYRLTDHYLDPDPAQDSACYAERCLRLPDTWICYDPLIELAARTTCPAADNSFITFGSLNNPAKLNDPQLRLWAQVLDAVQGSRLLLQAFAPSHREHIRDVLKQPGRIEFVGRLPRAEYLRVYDRIDIALDTLPYNGITTTCDALWMGVPVITLTGQTAASRAGTGILSNLGSLELIADTPHRFIQIAGNLASDLPRLNDMRCMLRRRLESCPLMDPNRFARRVESAYREAWNQWCNTNSAQRV